MDKWGPPLFGVKCVECFQDMEMEGYVNFQSRDSTMIDGHALFYCHDCNRRTSVSFEYEKSLVGV